MVVGRFRKLQLRQDAIHVLLDGSFGDRETATDRGVRTTLGHESEDLMLARRERIVPAASIHQLPNEARVDDGRASDDSLDDIDELVDGRDSALEKVTNPLAAREQLDCVLDLNVRRDDQDGCVGELAPGVL